MFNLDVHFTAGSPAERLSVMNAARSVERAQPMFEVARPANEDVFFDLIEQEKVAWGQPFNIQVHFQVFQINIHSIISHFNIFPINFKNRSQEMRTITAFLSANSVYYTGVTARRLGRNDRQFVLQPGGRTY